MTDSNERDLREEKRAENREQRIRAVKRWARYIQENPPEVWGAQQNRLVNSQLEAARQTGLDAEHYRRVAEARRDR